MSIQFDIGELRTFVLLAENGHFTETAQTLGVSQPAVSQRIARLESSFGLMLFTRSAERATLTPYGRQLLESARRCVESHESMAGRLTRKQASTSNDCVRVWVDRSAAGDLLAEGLGKWSGGNFRVELVQTLAGNGWTERLRDSECDIAISGVFLQPEAPYGINRIDLCREPGLSAFWSRRHYPHESSFFEFSELLKTPVILPSERLVPGFRGFVEDWCLRAYGRPPASVLEFDAAASARHACCTGRGIRLLPGTGAGRLEAPEPRLDNHLLFNDVLPHAYVYGLHIRAGESNAAVMATASHLISEWKQISPKRQSVSPGM